MIKIMLVEDDKSLREIYGVRLLAEGYDIVTASNGEEALALAIKERPGLIITDIMMPTISGFDMLDILRSTSETRDIKVIMMTALSSEDQRQRGEQLGADRFLVKSQVGIEDVVRVVHEVLGDAPAKAAPTAPLSAPPVQATPAPAPVGPAPVISTIPAPQAARPPQITVPPRPVAPVPDTVVPTPPPAAPVSVAPPTIPVAPAPVMPVTPPSTTTTASPPSAKQRTIQPINDPSTKVNINELLDRELAKEAGVDFSQRPPVQTTSQEKAQVQDQINQFAAQPGAAPSNAATNVAPPRPQAGPSFGPPPPPPPSGAAPTPQV